MAFVRNVGTDKDIGDEVVTTIKHENFAGYFEVGTKVKIIGISERGYDIEDEEGNRVREIGWII